VNEFVEECRREWKRLHVSDPIANEMAADLEADLNEAEAEGASPEEVLGSGAFDPRSFAASWASERGVAQPTATTVSQATARTRPRRQLRVLAMLAGSAVVGLAGLVVLVGAALVFGRVRSSHGISAPVIRGVPVPGVPVPPFPRVGAGPAIVRVTSSHAPIGAVGLLVLLVLLVAIIGLILMALLRRPWENAGRWSPPRHDRDQTPESQYS
jgi:hypothetical protein